MSIWVTVVKLIKSVLRSCDEGAEKKRKNKNAVYQDK